MAPAAAVSVRRAHSAVVAFPPPDLMEPRAQASGPVAYRGTGSPRRRDRDSPMGSSRTDNSSIRTANWRSRAQSASATAFVYVQSHLQSRKIRQALVKKRTHTLGKFIGRGAGCEAFGLPLQLRVQQLPDRSFE